MLGKTIILGLAAAVLLLSAGPSAAKLERGSMLRSSFAATADWSGVLGLDGQPLTGMLSRSDDGAVVLKASVELDPAPSISTLPAQPRPGDYGLFGSVAFSIGTLPATKQWRRVSTSDFTDRFGAHCAVAACHSGTAEALMAAARAAEGQPAMDALTLVNAAVNRLIRYRADVGDEWATPVETAARGAGDCEDFAIAKLWMLRSIGYTPDQLQLVVLKDVRRGLYHAVLGVHLGAKTVILDNLSNRVLADTALRNYQPIESFSGNKSFIHGFAGKSIETAALTGGPAIAPSD